MSKPKRKQQTQADWIASIGEPNRLILLRALTTGPYTVTQLAKVCDLEPHIVSKHLGVLREAGLVTCERDGRFQCYALTGAKATAILLELTHESGIKVLISLT